MLLTVLLQCAKNSIIKYFAFLFFALFIFGNCLKMPVSFENCNLSGSVKMYLVTQLPLCLGFPFNSFLFIGDLCKRAAGVT